MLEFNRVHLFKLLAAMLCIVGVSWLALDYFVPTLIDPHKSGPT